MRRTAAVLAIIILVGLLGSPRHSRAAETPWVDDLAYGSAGGGFYWDTASQMVWTAERGWHYFAPRPDHPHVPLWVNYLTYGSAGGGFYWDPVSGQVWTAERGWHYFNPRPGDAKVPKAQLTLEKFGTGGVTSSPAGLDCAAPCGSGSAAFPVGTVVVLTAGSPSAVWSGCDSVSGARCTVAVSADRQVLVAFADPPTLRPNTRILSNDTLARLLRKSASQLVFSSGTAALSDVKVGDILVGGADGGFLRRVTAVSTAGGEIALTTVDASFDEAMSGGTLVGQSGTPQQSGLSLDSAAGEGEIHVSISGDASLGGKLSIGVPDVFFAVQPGKEAIIAYTQTVTAEMVLEAKGALNLSNEWTNCGIPPVPLPDILILVPPIAFPVVFKPEVSFPCKLEISLSVANRLTLTATHTETLTLRCSLVGSINCKPGRSQQTAWGYSVASKKGSATVKYGIGPEASLKLYGLAGPYFNISLYGKAKMGVPSPLTGSFSGGIEANMGLKAELPFLGVRLGEKVNFTLGAIEVELARWGPVPLNVSVDGHGSVTGPGIQCPSDCVEPQELESKVDLTARSDTGWEFDRWEGCASSSGTSCSVFMGSERWVIAHFRELPKPVVPFAVISVHATALSSSSIRVDWTPDSGPTATGFRVHETTPGDHSYNIDGNGRSYTVTGLRPDTQYCYEVIARNAAGESDVRTFGCATTEKAPVVNYSATLTVDRGAGATYHVGDRIQMCYHVSPEGIPFHYRIYKNGDLIRESDDNGIGGGDCLNGTVASSPVTTVAYRLDVFVGGQKVADADTYIYVQGASEPTLRRLGGLNNLTGYCQSRGYSNYHLVKPVTGPNAAYNNWYCGPSPIDWEAACKWHYPSYVIDRAAPDDPNNAYSWVCYGWG